MAKTLLTLSFFITFLSFSQDLQYLWSAKFGNLTPNVGVIPKEIVIDKHNNKYICGVFSGTHDFDPGLGVFELTSLDNTSISTAFVIKLDSMNNFLWVNSYGTTGSTLVNYGLVVDSLGNAYTYGYYSGNLFYDPQNSLNSVSPFWSNSDFYIHKLDANGHYKWIKAWGGNNDDGIYKIILDQDQNFYIEGSYNISTDINPGSGTYTLTSNSSYTSNIFIAKYDFNFNVLWAKQYEGSGHVFFPKMSLDNNEITLTGKYTGVIDFDMSTSGVDLDTSFFYTDDMFTHVMDRSGNHKWHHSIKGPATEQNFSSDIDSDHNRYILGSFNSTMDFNPEAASNIIEIVNPSNFNFDNYIMKLDSTGRQIWTRAIQGSGTREVDGLKIESDQIILYGSLTTKADLNPKSGILMVEPPLMINYLVYIEKLDTNANILWHEEFVCSSVFNITDFEFGKDNNYYIIGQIEGLVDINPGPDVNQISHNQGMATYLGVFKELPCSQLGVYLSNSINATCSSAGSVIATGVYGTSPYSYKWLTNPQNNNTILTTDTCGLFFIEVMDNNGCIDTSSVYIDGPISSNNSADLDINLVSTTFIQGQPAIIWIESQNNGCQNINGTVRLILDSLVQYDSSSVVPNSIVGDTISWNLNFGNNDSIHNIITVYVTSSQLLITGDTVCFISQVNPLIGDLNPENNIKEYCEPVFASYDPNDKKVFPKGICNDNVYMGQPLTYTVRFQNTGNSEAIHVNIIDTIDVNLNPSTLKIISHSHPGLSVNYSGAGDRELQFNFQNIHLPDSLSDPIGSNGYVVFELEPNDGMEVNTLVSNKVNIFFDFNTPILTNTASIIFTNDIPCVQSDNVGITEIDKLNFQVFPNPSDDIITFYLADDKPSQLKLYSYLGELVLSTEIINGSNLSINKFPEGLYFVAIEGYSVKKIVKIRD